MDLEFRKSSYSANGQNCVEVAASVPGVAAVRDTQHRELGHLGFSPVEFTAFLDAVKAGDL